MKQEVDYSSYILDFREKYELIAGVDEVGRGPLIGDVVTAAVILNPDKPIEGLMDSKKLTEKKREFLYDKIVENALAYSIARSTAQEIDDINILNATMLAMTRAVSTLQIKPNFVLVDGNRVPKFEYPAFAVVKGDNLVAEISAASILAKVTRDREMKHLDTLHPEYGFAKHKGYPTKQHIEAIAKHGILPDHRKSFAPVANLLSY